MTNDELWKWQKQQPFQPFEIVLVDGRSFEVRHPDFIWAPPGRGTWVYVAHDGSGSADHVNTAVKSSIRKIQRNGHNNS